MRGLRCGCWTAPRCWLLLACSPPLLLLLACCLSGLLASHLPPRHSKAAHKPGPRRPSLHLLLHGDEPVRGTGAVAALLAPQGSAAPLAPLPVPRPLASPAATSPTHPLPCVRSCLPRCFCLAAFAFAALQAQKGRRPWCLAPPVPCACRACVAAVPGVWLTCQVRASCLAESQTMLAWVDRDLELYMALSPLAVSLLRCVRARVCG